MSAGELSKIAVIGAGAWGTALACAYAKTGVPVALHGRNADHIRQIAETGENTRFLPSIPIEPSIALTADRREALAGASHVFLATPAQSVQAVIEEMALEMTGNPVLISCAKGIDRASGKRMGQLIAERFPACPFAVLSGPSFAEDVARGLPTAVTIAASDEQRALAIARALNTRTLRLYASDDIVGVEWGGSLKNVLAIGAGIVEGRGLGESAKAALTTRGFAEISRIAIAMGARRETLMGLSGLGDLVLTCASPKSRNFAYGIAIGRGDDMSNLKLAEGAATSGVAARIAKSHGIEAPLVATIAGIIDGQIGVDEAMASLMMRDVKIETA